MMSTAAITLVGCEKTPNLALESPNCAMRHEIKFRANNVQFSLPWQRSKWAVGKNSGLISRHGLIAITAYTVATQVVCIR